MQGTFNITAKGPEGLSRVVFFLDEEIMGEVIQVPFCLQFRTEAYPTGLHTFSAIGYTIEGRQLGSDRVTAVFVTPGEGGKEALRLILILGGAFLGAMVLSTLVTGVTGRGKKSSPAAGSPRNYGASGGAICPKCARPFPLRFLGVNLGPWHKFDRCPYCGKWVAMKKRSLAELRAAEQAEREQEKQVVLEELSEEEKLRRDLDASRYQ
jgi:hypothetical protein